MPALSAEFLTAAGTTQATATAIPIKSSPSLIVAAGDDVVGIRLPQATETKWFVIKNTGTGGLAGKLNVYPATGDTINLLGTNNPIQMATLTSATFYAASSTQWYTVPTVPS